MTQTARLVTQRFGTHCRCASGIDKRGLDAIGRRFGPEYRPHPLPLSRGRERGVQRRPLCRGRERGVALQTTTGSMPNIRQNATSSRW